ncbi:GNAT family N-acetyltransferase [Desulfobulbus oligotrophicus]|jgi:putative acetyltransferase|uniref:GNAT family N-acetyltransferase n=1 Tax=Desulfobulbus oligotrophicus TaxID=1909699 RepID=UPI0018EF16EC|nr:N-acetyltransferase [Desulfobulbus oligotrophicus]MDY0391673.1 N-acetyltransferase [Desulfobulbus oligotrophicus]
MHIVIRPEQPADIERIRALTLNAFVNQAQSNHTEHRIIDRLRETHALAISLLAEVDGEIVGHIAFSEVDISDSSTGWYGLGPLSVLPAMQRKGIGRALVEAGLKELRKRGAQGCLLLGNPSFYRRFGFANNPDLLLAEFPQEHFLALSLTGENARGVVTYHPSFFNNC